MSTLRTRTIEKPSPSMHQDFSFQGLHNLRVERHCPFMVIDIYHSVPLKRSSINFFRVAIKVLVHLGQIQCEQKYRDAMIRLNLNGLKCVHN